MIKSAEAVQFRKNFPEENTFASKLAAVLSNPDKLWRKRPEFRGIDDDMAQTFLRYCEDASLALTALRSQNIVPNALEFYRSLAYQCADLYPAESNQPRAMKNLLQSVFAQCELDRETSQGTYYGTRIAELPPTTEALDGKDLLGLRELVLPAAAEIPVAENIGEVVRRVLEECAGDLADLCAPKEQMAENRIVDKWGHVADAFARHSVDRKPVTWTHETKERWQVASHRVHAVLFLIEGSVRVAIRLGQEFSHQSQVESGIFAVAGLTLCSKPVVGWIRRGKAYDDRDTERARVRRIILEAKGVRTGALSPH